MELQLPPKPVIRNTECDLKLTSNTMSGSVWKIGDPAEDLYEASFMTKNKKNKNEYRKPTDMYRYLHYRSFHPVHQKRSIPYSQIVSVRRICSDKRDFFHHTNEMISYLLTRQYPFKLLLDSQTKAAQLDRATLLQPPPRGRAPSNIPLIITYDQLHGHISSSVNASKFLLENVKPYLHKKRLLVTFRRNKNFRDLLINSSLLPPTQTKGCHLWGKPCC